MIRPLRHTLCLLLLATAAACSKDEAQRWLTVTPEEVVVAGAEGSTAEFSITARGSWSIQSDDGRYRVDPVQGEAGTTTVTLTVTEENPDRQSRRFRPLTVTAGNSHCDVKVVQRPKTVPQALLFFFIGTDLQRFFDVNLQDAMDAMTPATPGEGRVAAFCLTGGKWSIVELAYDYQKGKGAQTLLKQYDRIDRSDPASITQVINDMQTLVPAHEYGLIFGGHGTGWVPVGTTLDRSGAFGATAFGTADPGVGPDGKPYPVTRYFGETGSAYDIDQIARSLDATQIRFRYILFDDCFMSNIETLYALRNNARYIIASPCEVMGEGFPYHYVIPALFRENGTASDLQEVCERFYNYYLNEYSPHYPSGCVAMTDCAELEALAEASRRIFTDATHTCDPSALQTYEGLSEHVFYDFRQYVEQIATNSAALADFRAQFDRTFPEACRLHTPTFYSWYNRSNLLPINYYSGVTCSAPSKRYTDANRATEWWTVTH